MRGRESAVWSRGVATVAGGVSATLGVTVLADEETRGRLFEPFFCIPSGYLGEEVFSRGVAAQGFLFLQKPFTPGGLLSQVQEVLEMAEHSG